MPTSLAPSRTTSPGPSPSKQIVDDHSVVSSGPRWTSTRPARPGAAATSASHTIDPIRHIDARTSSRLVSLWRGTITSSQNDLARHEQHRSPAAAPPDDVDAGARAGVVVDRRLGLARAEHERRLGHLVPPDRRGGRIGDRPVVQRSGRSRSVFEGEAVQRRAQDAIGRYGRQVSGMPLTDTITQAVARGRGTDGRGASRLRRACDRAW